MNQRERQDVLEVLINGKKTRVATGSLSQGGQERVRKMAAGGEVADYTSLPDAPAAPLFGPVAVPNPMAGAVVPNPMAGAPVMAPTAQTPQMPGAPTPGVQIAPFAGESDFSQFASPGALPGAAPQQGLAAPAEQAQSAPRVAGMAAPRPAQARIGAPGRLDEYGQAQATEEKALAEKAGIEQQRFEETARLQQQGVADQQNLIAQHEQKWQENNKRITDLQNAVLSQKIDPSALWESKSGGQKAMAIVGMILGGIGSGITGRENPAMQALQQAIDRDVRAQEANIQNKKTALGAYIEQGHSLQAARQMAIGEKMHLVAAQVEATANKYGGLAALPGAAAQVAELHKQGAQFRLNAAQQSAQTALAYQDMQLKAQTLALEKRKFGAYEQAMQGGQGGASGGMALDKGAMPLNPLDPLKDRQERSYQDAEGRWHLAPSAKEAEASRERVVSAGELKGTMTALGAAKSRTGVLDKLASMIGRPEWTAQGAQNAILKDQFIIELADTKGVKLSNLNPTDRALFDRMVPDPSAFRDASFQPQIQQALRTIRAAQIARNRGG